MSVCVDCSAARSPGVRGRRTEPMRDPSFPIAVRALERHPDYREAARLCPDLAAPDTAPLAAPAHCNVVLLHGGLSNCLSSFGDGLIGGRAPLLRPRPGLNIYRFEHDTWLPVKDNVAQLVSLVQQKLRGESLLFIGFSRGGVVATRAAAQLRDIGAIASAASPDARQPGTHGDAAVMTFGSPHRGFRTGDLGWHVPRVCYCLQYAVSSTIRHLSPSHRLAIFIESLRLLSHIPPGIADIATRNPELEEFIQSAAGRWIEQRLHAYGGSPDKREWLPRWLRPLLSRPVPGIGDGAVSLSSATAYGAERKEVLGCGHDDYFFRPDVRAAIARCLIAMMAFTASPAASPATS